MGVSIARLKALNAVAQYGSYSAAARALGVAQPSVSQHIHDTEREYGVRLFERRGGQLQATPLCRELCDIAERMSEAESSAARLLNRRNTLPEGELRVGLGNSMPGIAVIGRFRQRYPDVSIVVRTGSHEDITRAVLAREVDVGMLPDVSADGRFRRELVVRQDVVAIAHAQSPIARADMVSCERLFGEPLIFRSRGSSTQRVVDRAFRASGLEPRPRLVLDTRDGVYEAVANGLGVGFMWRHGTGRLDAVRRVTVREMAKAYDEMAFALADERGAVVEAYFDAVRAFRSGQENPASHGWER